MKVNIGVASHNSADWEGVEAGQFDRPAQLCSLFASLIVANSARAS